MHWIARPKLAAQCFFLFKQAETEFFRQLNLPESAMGRKVLKALGISLSGKIGRSTAIQGNSQLP
jgi:hypothetical protein